MHFTRSIGLAAVAFAGIVSGRIALGEVVASDNASDPAYADGWQIGDNGGTGFLPWSNLGPYGGGPMDIDTGPDPENDLGSPAFRIGNGVQGFIIDRQFETPLQVGDVFSIDFDTYPIFPDGGQVLISFGAEDGDDSPMEPDERIAFYAYYYDDGSFIFGSDFWGINAETANDNLNGGVSLPEDPLGGIEFQTTYTTTDGSDGFTLSVEIESTDTYRLRVDDDGETKLDISGQMYASTAGELINEISIFGDIVTDASFEQVVYINNLQITASDAGLPGDFNGDGTVDAADYTVWRDNEGATDESALNGNGNGMNGVDAADYQLWVDHFGEGIGGGSAAMGVPEPSMSLLVVVATLGCMLYRWRT